MNGPAEQTVGYFIIKQLKREVTMQRLTTGHAARGQASVNDIFHIYICDTYYLSFGDFQVFQLIV